MSGDESKPEAKAGQEKDDGQKTDQNGDAKHTEDESVEAEKRKHQRGGRKGKSKSVQTSESHKPWSERNGRLEHFSEPEEPEEELEEQDARLNGDEPTSKNAIPEEFDTGIKAFNLKRAQSSGGRRPFGLSVDGGKKKETTSKKEKKKEKKVRKKDKKKKKREQESDEDEDSDSSSDEEPPRKPLSIRLDLNLELEIFLRAKVKGDITITFLE